MKQKVSKNNIITQKIKLIRSVFKEIHDEDITMKENIKKNLENKMNNLKKNNSESIFKNNKSELVKLPKNINEVKSEINFLTKSDKKKDNELK